MFAADTGSRQEPHGQTPEKAARPDSKIKAPRWRTAALNRKAKSNSDVWAAGDHIAQRSISPRRRSASFIVEQELPW
jgi:hypothetical protein